MTDGQWHLDRFEMPRKCPAPVLIQVFVGNQQTVLDIKRACRKAFFTDESMRTHVWVCAYLEAVWINVGNRNV